MKKKQDSLAPFCFFEVFQTEEGTKLIRLYCKLIVKHEVKRLYHHCVIAGLVSRFELGLITSVWRMRDYYLSSILKVVDVAEAIE